jgi:hypothetical protein
MKGGMFVKVAVSIGEPGKVSSKEIILSQIE